MTKIIDGFCPVCANRKLLVGIGADGKFYGYCPNGGSMKRQFHTLFALERPPDEKVVRREMSKAWHNRRREQRNDKNIS